MQSTLLIIGAEEVRTYVIMTVQVSKEFKLTKGSLCKNQFFKVLCADFLDGDFCAGIIVDRGPDHESLDQMRLKRTRQCRRNHVRFPCGFCIFGGVSWAWVRSFLCDLEEGFDKRGLMIGSCGFEYTPHFIYFYLV